MKAIKIVGIVLLLVLILTAASSLLFSTRKNIINPPSKEESDVIYTQELNDVSPTAPEVSEGEVNANGYIYLEPISVEDYSYMLVVSAFMEKNRLPPALRGERFKYGKKTKSSISNATFTTVTAFFVAYLRTSISIRSIHAFCFGITFVSRFV